MRIITPSFIGIAGFVFVACESPKPGGNGKVTPPTTTHCPARPAAKSFPGFSAGEIIRIDVAAMDGLIAPGARIEKLAGPGSRYGSLTGTSHSLAEGFNGVTDEPGSNGLLIDPEGRLVLCQHGNRMVARLGISLRNPKPIYEVLAERHDGKRLNSPNDGCYNSHGDLYFTDPPYGLEEKMADPAKELDFQGVYLLRREHLQANRRGELVLLTKEVTRPNGIALSPDEQTLYVAVSDRNRTHIRSYPVKADGTLGSGGDFFDASPLTAAERAKRPGEWPGSCDGMKVDERGNLWATGPRGVMIISPSGKLLGRIRTGERTSNCAWGDDGCTLYITADMYLLRVRTRTKGAGF